MKVTDLDPYFFYKRGSKGLDGMQIMQVDDTCGGGTNEFSILETVASKKFKRNSRISELPLKFNDMQIEQVRDDFIIYQKTARKFKKLNIHLL